MLYKQRPIAITEHGVSSWSLKLVSSTMNRASVVIKPEEMVIQSLNPEGTWSVFKRPTHER